MFLHLSTQKMVVRNLSCAMASPNFFPPKSNPAKVRGPKFDLRRDQISPSKPPSALGSGPGSETIGVWRLGASKKLGWHLAYKWDIIGILLEYIWHINGIYMEY